MFNLAFGSSGGGTNTFISISIPVSPRTRLHSSAIRGVPEVSSLRDAILKRFENLRIWYVGRRDGCFQHLQQGRRLCGAWTNVRLGSGSALHWKAIQNPSSDCPIGGSSRFFHDYDSGVRVFG